MKNKFLLTQTKLLLLTGSLALATPLRADGPPAFVFQIPSSAAPGGFSPNFLALDASNNVYVTDESNNRILKFTASGAFLTQWGSIGSGPGQIYQPEGIAVAGTTNVYVTDYNNERVEKYNGTGGYITQWGSFGNGNGQFQGLYGIAVDSGNNVYVADVGHGRVEKFDANGNYLTQWGSTGSGIGQLYDPEYLAVDGSSNVYVCDSGNNRVEKFDANGDYLTQWGSLGTNNGQLDYPEGIAVDGSGNVYVCDTSNRRVEKFDDNGNYLAQFGGASSGPGQLNAPMGIALDNTGNYIYVGSYGSTPIAVFVNNTNIIPPYIVQQPTNQTVPAGTNVTLSSGVVGAALSYQWSFNNVAVAGATNAAFTLTNVSPSESATYTVLVSNSYGSASSSNAVLSVLAVGDFAPPTFVFEIDPSAVFGGFEPNSVALDASNNVYVTDQMNNRVLKFTAGGAYLSQWGSYGSSNGQFYNPEGIAVDGSNNIYVVDLYNERIEKFDPNGNYLNQWGSSGSSNSQFNGPTGLAVDSSDNVYVADAGNFRVEKFNGNGAYIMQWGGLGSGNGQFRGPIGIAVDGSNYVYVTDQGNNRVEKFDDNGNYLTQWGTYGFGNDQAPYADGIAVDGHNHLYVADENNDLVEKFDNNGNYLAQWGSQGSNNSQFNNPAAIALDHTGNMVYVVDTGNDRIEVFVNDPGILSPIITEEPASQIVAAGVSVTFGVGIVGTPPFGYQWSSNNVAVPGATNATFTLTNVSLTESGVTCAVQITNGYGSATSANAVLTVVPAADFVPPTFVFQIAPSVALGGFFPSFVALDSSNNVYMTDYVFDRVVKFAGDGNYLTQWGIKGGDPGQFNGPEGIAVDGSNNVYVVDLGNSRIEKFDVNGNYLNQWGAYGTSNAQFVSPIGIAVDSANNVYVVDQRNYRVEKFDSDGDYLTQWGSYGSSAGQLSDPVGIAVDRNNNVYVTDEQTYQVESRVVKFDSNGIYLGQWGNGQFDSPTGIAVDSSDNVYVADDDRIEKFYGNGGFLTQWGGAGSGNGQLNGPQGVALDRSGNFIYVADYGNARIEVFVNDTTIIPPFIEQQPPTNQLVAAGVNVTFSVTLIGATPFSYQWNSNNVALPGATNATLTLTNVNPSDSATYSILVNNSYGGILSSNSVLTVLPILVTTQPASGLSATGAVLNGSVTIGADETVVWFEWGTDTNYGNIAGLTTVPGNSASNQISAPLNGLPGNFYHYRLAAANDFGLVYGADKMFTVGFVPSATTLLPTNAANGATFEATVNPEGWDTTVYFEWGNGNFANTTPGMDIGAGAAALNVSNFVPGLLSSIPYQYVVVASNALGIAVGKVVFGDPNQYHFFFSGVETNVTLSPGTYIITAYGAPGGYRSYSIGGRGAEMSAEFNFATPTTLTLLVGGAGGSFLANYGGGGGGGGSFVVEGSTPLVVAGGGGGGGDYYGNLDPGNVSPSGDGGGGNVSGYYVNGAGAGGAGGANGGGGGVGIGLSIIFGGFGPDYFYGGSGGGGFLGNGAGPAGGASFTNGGAGGGGNVYYDAAGGFGGGGAGGDDGAPGGGGGYSGGGGGGYYARWESGYGGGGGSIIDASALTNLAEIPGRFSPNDRLNGEIIITLVPPPPLTIASDAALGFTNKVFGFNVTGPSGSNVVVQASTDLQTWIPVQTNLLVNGSFYFSDPQWTNYTNRYYRLQMP